MSIIKKMSLCCCCCKQTISYENPADHSINPSEHVLLVQPGGNEYLSGTPASSSSISSQSYTSRYHSMASSIGYERCQYEHSVTRSCRGDDEAKCTYSPPLKCFVIPSFGKDPPGNVALKKMAGDFLKGVREDFQTIQQLIKEDGYKQLLEVEFMCHFAQNKVATFKERIKDAMQTLNLDRIGCKYMFEECTCNIVLMCY